MIRPLIERLIIGIIGRASPSHRDWAAAMVAEILSIENDRAAFVYAIGCYGTIFVEHQKENRGAPLLQGAMIVALIGWAMAKAYLTTLLNDPGNIASPGWVIAATLGAGAAYFVAAGALALRQWAIFGACLFLALFINWLQLTASVFQQTAFSAYFYAILVEESFVWIGFVCAAATLLYIRGFRPTKSNA